VTCQSPRAFTSAFGRQQHLVGLGVAVAAIGGLANSKGVRWLAVRAFTSALAARSTLQAVVPGRDLAGSLFIMVKGAGGALLSTRKRHAQEHGHNPAAVRAGVVSQRMTPRDDVGPLQRGEFGEFAHRSFEVHCCGVQFRQKELSKQNRICGF